MIRRWTQIERSTDWHRILKCLIYSFLLGFDPPRGLLTLHGSFWPSTEQFFNSTEENDPPLNNFSAPRKKMTLHWTIFLLHGRKWPATERFFCSTEEINPPLDDFSTPRKKMTGHWAISVLHGIKGVIPWRFLLSTIKNGLPLIDFTEFTEGFDHPRYDLSLPAGASLRVWSSLRVCSDLFFLIQSGLAHRRFTLGGEVLLRVNLRRTWSLVKYPPNSPQNGWIFSPPERLGTGVFIAPVHYQ